MPVSYSSLIDFNSFSIHIVGVFFTEYGDIDGLAQDCSNSTANKLELLQSCT